MSQGYWDDISYLKIALRGGDWQIGLRIARRAEVDKDHGVYVSQRPNVQNWTSERKSLRELSRDIGIHQDTVAKYLATWEWAAADGLVDKSANLTPGYEYDFDALTHEDWKTYYRKACDNAPPWNPNRGPLEPRRGPDRHVAKEHVVTAQSVAEAIRSDPVLAKAAAEELDAIARAKNKARHERHVAEQEAAGVSREEYEKPYTPPEPDAMDRAFEYASEEAGRREAIRELQKLAHDGRVAMQALAQEYQHTGVADEVEWLHQMTADLTEWQWASASFIVEPARKAK